MAKKTSPPADAPAADQTSPPADAPAVATIPMVREGKTADVHPDEVENWRACGWALLQ